MTFLQPWVLVALPLVALPLVIHLINQRRFQTVPWAAMQFLLAAKALSRGYSRLRHWLIMALRMLAVAAVILAVGRPLSRGWLALAAGGRPDSAIVVLDRSPSMQATAAAGGASKLETGRRQLAESLATLEARRVMVVVDPARGAEEVASPAAIADLATTGPAAAAADLPALLRAAYDSIREHAAGTTEIWICSDQRGNDWKPDEGSWGGLRDAFAKLPQQVRFQLLAYTAQPPGNVAVRVPQVRLETPGRDRRLVVTVAVSRQADGDRLTLPVKIEIGGVTTSVELDLVGREAVLKNHVIPLERSAGARGWGRVSIPADADPADNEYFFVYDAPPPRRVVVVAEDPAAGRALELVAGIAPDKSAAEVDLVSPGSVATAAWDAAAAVLWQGPLPEGRDADLLQAFVARGGQVIFFAPDRPTAAAFAGGAFGEWTTHGTAVAAESWRTDQDLLANTLAGSALPLGDVAVTRSCGLTGDLVPLATLPGGSALVARSSLAEGVTFVATTPAPRDSSLAAEGVVLYAMVHRAIDRGLAALAGARQADAGPAAADVARACAGGWTRVAGEPATPSTEAGLHAGVFSCGERLVAVNRPPAEDAATVLADDRVEALFRGLPFARLTGTAGDTASLVQEIWRAFLISLLLALVAEGLLSLPRPVAAGHHAAASRRLEEAA
ncbi:MAG: BatA domain-containing protein [Pirellulales bacterium]